MPSLPGKCDRADDQYSKLVTSITQLTSDTTQKIMQSKFWCFTINNPVDDEEQGVVDFLSSRFASYGIIGRETGQSGTPHLQGFVVLSRAQRLSYVRNRISPRGHYEVMLGTPQQASEYCKKDGDFEEFGTLPASEQGRRSDIDRITEWVDQFTADNGRHPGSPDFAKHQPTAYVRYPRLTRLAALRAPRRQLEFGEPNVWQRELSDRLSDPADDRTVDFIIDPEGGKGKTWFCRWMLSNHDKVQVLGVGKKDDIAHMLDTTKSIFLFNVARGQMEYLSYPLLENLKDRLVQSGKYNSSMKVWDTKVHVVVLGNEEPDMTKMTADRYYVVNV